MEQNCFHCNSSFSGRPDKKFCSTRCYQRHWYNRPSFPYERDCRACGKPFMVAERVDANRQHCSQACSKLAWRKGSIVWLRLHPEKTKQYGVTRKKKHPTIWRDKARDIRKQSLELLGGECVVCGVNNPNWLHIDYIPTCKGLRYRHSKTIKFIRDNLIYFRLLCANHHYELIMTGKIEGTTIVQ